MLIYVTSNYLLINMPQTSAYEQCPDVQQNNICLIHTVTQHFQLFNGSRDT